MRSPKCQEELLGLFFLCCRSLHLKSPRTRWVPQPCVYSTGGVKDHEKSNGRSAFNTAVPDVAQTTFTYILLA